MYKTTLKIEGMMCGMCESHVNDAIRNAFKIKKVTSSHGRGETVITSDAPLDEQALRDTIDKTGYKVLSVSSEEEEKHGLFHRG